ncbi:MAG: T9SS type A sorting domain-containing protein, partial [Candidatus Krumholzibacteria bacterium]|nr:T9SS type A sorting domain-containing protein [Candidatus Krumholzibacteria bacterium]
PLENLVLYSWGARGVVAGCPVDWPYVGGVNLFYGEQKDWYRHRAEFAYLIGAGSDQVQVRIGVGDFCYIWCGQLGDGDCHSHAPLVDNVRVVRVDLEGPAWQVRERDLFQDNFASDGTKTGTVYIDVASEHLYVGGRADSTFVKVVAYGVGVDNHVPGDPSSGPAVYCHVKDVTPAKSGDAISGNTVRWPVVSAAGGWTVLRCDSVFKPYNPPSIEDDYYCVDLNDNLFTPGDTIWYYFSARDANGNTNYYSVLGGVTGTEAEARAWPMEVTCLPANALGGATDVLYVDDFDNRGAQPLIETAFELLGLTPDRYDVLAPSAIVGNGPGSRVVNVAQQISDCYQKIIWNSGDLKDGLIGDGTGNPSKSNDFGLLYAFLDQSNDSPGLYISGDNLAEEWVTLAGTDAVKLRSDYIDFNFIGGDHVALGEPVSPLVIGLPGGAEIFDHPAGPDTLVAFGGGCGIIADFDVLDAGAAAAMEMAYSGAAAHGAVLSQATPNSVGDTARVVLSGFSYHWIRDDRAATPIDRAEHLADIIRWLGNDVAPPTGAADGRTYAYSLGQNYPNPFNPSTTIGFTVAQSGHVTLKIYDVAGRLVRTLVDERRRPGTVYSSKWDGRNDSGERVASGVYFYKLVAGNFTQVRKLVLLK